MTTSYVVSLQRVAPSSALWRSSQRSVSSIDVFPGRGITVLVSSISLSYLGEPHRDGLLFDVATADLEAGWG